MAWLPDFGGLAGGLAGDFAGAVNKLSESVKNIEINFDSGILGLEDKPLDSSGLVQVIIPSDHPISDTESYLPENEASKLISSPDGEETLQLFPVDSNVPESAPDHVADTVQIESQEKEPEEPDPADSVTDVISLPEEHSVAPLDIELNHTIEDVKGLQAGPEPAEVELSSPEVAAEVVPVTDQISQVEYDPAADVVVPPLSVQHGEEVAGELSEIASHEGTANGLGVVEEEASGKDTSSPKTMEEESPEVKEESEAGEGQTQVAEAAKVVEAEEEKEQFSKKELGLEEGVGVGSKDEGEAESEPSADKSDLVAGIEALPPTIAGSSKADSETVPDSERRVVEVTMSSEMSQPAVPSIESSAALESEMEKLEVALQSAARQAQGKADELANFMSQNDELKVQVYTLRKQLDSAKEQEKKAVDMALEALREEYQHRISAAERKAYALTKERDMLRREQNRKNDTAALLKEKDEIIKQVMAEGEELSKKQATQEQQMKKLRSQIRELEDDKQRLNSRLQVEEARVESIRKEKSTMEKSLQDAVERGQAELIAQKEFFSSALSQTKEALAMAEARADSEAKADLDRKLKEAGEREKALVNTVDDLRQALSRTEQQAALREELLRRDIDDLEKRCQAAERRHEDLMARIPDSTRPLLRQIEAMQESANMRVEALTGVERALNSRLQEAEAKMAASQERERASNERLTQTLSRISVMEAQLSLLRSEQSLLSRTLEKERSRAAESRQEYLAAQEVVATMQGKVKQLEEELRDARARHRKEMNDERGRREAREQEIEKERSEYERRSRGIADPLRGAAAGNSVESGGVLRSSLLPNSNSRGSAEEGSYLAATLNPSESPLRSPGQIRNHGSLSKSAIFAAASMEQMETVLRHKEGELASWMARLAALETTRDSLAEELVKTTQQFELLRSEASILPGLKAELDALRRRHTSALELMGERDEQVEELRADLMDVKQMYREQIDMLVNQIQDLSTRLAVNET